MRRPIGEPAKVPLGVLIDREDIPLISAYNNWNISIRGDVVSNYQMTVEGKRTYRSYKLHRVIMGVTDPDILVDHRDRNPLNNRRSNLRVCKQISNGKNLSKKKNNTSGFHGVRWDKERQKWIARIKVNYVDKHLGRYNTMEEAISARLFGEDYYFGEYAPNL